METNKRPKVLSTVNSKKKPKISSKFENELLPIHNYKEILIESVKTHSTTIVIGETGSGKSTQLPQYLANSLSEKNGCIVCTQPRRVAAITVAERVAQERNCAIGQEVGYSIRFEDKTSNKTKIKYVTDGVLLREFMSNPNLDGYDVIILDEAHERSLQTDILMGLLHELQQKKPDLRLVVMSATLQVDLFMNFFKDCNLVVVPGRQYPVDIYYTNESQSDFVDAAFIACLQIHHEEDPGGVLVFLPGQDEIENLHQLLEEHLPFIESKSKKTLASIPVATPTPTSSSALTDSDFLPTGSSRPLGAGVMTDFEIRPLYAALPPDEQLRAFSPAPHGVRKFILATNIAETSVTISGVKYVIDTGYAKARSLQEGSGFEMLKITPVSQSQANQRAGRAGRESSGKCFRLYTEETFELMEQSTTPEIQRVNISQVILQMKVYGIASVDKFRYPSPPTVLSLRKALAQLLGLGALDQTQSLTPHGRMMSALPLDPIFAHLLLKSLQYKCVAEVLTAVAMLSTDTIFLQPHKDHLKQAAHQAHRRFTNRDGDLLTLVSIYDSWVRAGRDFVWSKENFLSHRALVYAYNIRNQLTVILIKLKVDTTLSCAPEKVPFMRCLADGLFMNIAKRTVTMDSQSQPRGGGQHIHKFHNSSANNSYKEPGKAPFQTLKGNQPVFIHPSSVLFSVKKLPDFVVYSELLLTSKLYMRNISVIDADMIPNAGAQKKN